MTPEQLRELRMALGLSAQDAAKLAGLAHLQSWQRYEQGTRSLPDPSAHLFSLRLFGLPLLMRAMRLASTAYAGQTRKGIEQQPYIFHPLDAAMAAVQIGLVTDPEILAAIILHDAIENGGATAQEVQDATNERVLAMVQAVTDPPAPRDVRRERRLALAPQMDLGAATVKLADVFANVGDLIESPPVGWSWQRINGNAKYYRELALALPKVNRRLLRAVLERCDMFLL